MHERQCMADAHEFDKLNDEAIDTTCFACAGDVS